MFDLNIIEKYMKGLNNIDSNDIMSSWLPQSKLYLKILKFLKFLKNTNLIIISNIIEIVIKYTHIFNDIILVRVKNSKIYLFLFYFLILFLFLFLFYFLNLELEINVIL